jgi:HSP20 family protein
MSSALEHAFPDDYRMADESGGPPPDWEIYLRPQATLLRVHEACWTPPTDVYETDDAFHIRVEIAGVNREEIKVVVDRDMLMICGRRKDHTSKNKIRFRQVEIKYGRFEIKMRLPENVDPEKVEAVYSEGFLKAKLPKKQKPAQHKAKVVIRIG